MKSNRSGGIKLIPGMPVDPFIQMGGLRPQNWIVFS